jgi:hypothetical protein
MKSRIPCKPIMALAVTVLCNQVAPVLLAQNSGLATPGDGALAPASASEIQPVQLSPGVQEVMKLARAHVGDETITAFIGNSGTTYHLSVSDILYLRAQGVSDLVLTAMLNSQQKLAAASVQPAPQPAPAGPVATSANNNPQPAPAATQYAPTYDAAASVYAQPSTTYVYPAPAYSYYDSGPYYWGYPGLSLGFGFGGGYYVGYRWGGYYGGSYRGGYYGGGYHGGYHGGGYHGGGGGHH